MNSRPFCGRQTSENVVFCEWGDFGYMRILHSSAVLGRTPPTKYSQGFLELSRGGQKTGKNQGFLVVSCACFFSISSPHGHLSSWHTFLLANVSFILAFLLLLLCFPSFRWLCFLVSIHLYFCCVLYFSFSCLSLLSSLLVWQKPRSNHKISQILIVIFCFGACIPTLSLGPDNNPTRPREEPLKKFVFVALMLGLLAMCWNTYFYCAFTHHPKFAYKMGPNKNDNVSQNAKQESVF